MANINIRVDDNLKKEADELFASLGMNTTTAISIFLRKAVDYGGIPFRIKRLEPSKETLKSMQEASDPTIKRKRYTSVDEIMKDLDAGI